MKIYCSSCDKVQPVIIDNCRDVKTGEPFQDIVCKECHLVIASGTNIRREWVGLTDEGMRALVQQAREVPVEVPCPDYNERLLTLANAKLKELNA